MDTVRVVPPEMMTGDMVQELFIPALGMAMEDAILVEWTKEPGDEITSGDIVAVIETDKTAMEIVAEVNGHLGAPLASAGERIQVGTVIGHVIETGESSPAASLQATGDHKSSDSSASPRVPESKETVPETADEPKSGAVGTFRTPHRHSPRQRRLDREAAAKGSVDSPSSLSPPARLRAKIAAAAASRPNQANASIPAETPPPGERSRAEPADSLSRVARAGERAAKSVTESWQTMPHFAVGRDIDVTDALRYLECVRRTDPQVSLTDLLLQGAARAWAQMRPGSPDAVAIAVATDRRVVNIAVAGAADASLADLATIRRRAVERARRGVLIPDDLAQTELTVSNLGTHGVDWFTGIIPVGQLSLLTIGRVRGVLVVGSGDVLAVRRVVSVVANLDHRSLDGLDGAVLLDLLQQAFSAEAAKAHPAGAPTEGGSR